MPFTEFLLRATPEQARAVVEEVVACWDLRMEWKGPEDGVAGRGSEVGNFFGGAFAQRFAYPVTLRPHPDGLLLRIDEGDRGWMGGPLGAVRVRDRHQRVVGRLATAFEEQGFLVRRHDG